MERAIFGAGCFWGVEEAFRTVPGVVATRVGYAGGVMVNPSYRDVCTGQTGHAEVVEVEFDADKVTYADLLGVFWKTHDPTTLNRQGPDLGTQYRSAIYFTSEEQRRAALQAIDDLNASGRLRGPVVTDVAAAGEFYEAEAYHQKYLQKRGMGTCHI